LGPDLLPFIGEYPIKKKFIVSYEIDYVHRVTVGIEALDEIEANNAPNMRSMTPRFGMIPVFN